ncbi:hypothetical protein H5410_014742 [Solanum commersonii]|uniref:Uncharacterized protein n=1 Tax=Solanum commersonii TaxID=4109 RepID=A0A9J5ZRT3_SOLCO|nr:hypothetical protein H5410_014742 [Solanum commersonii]
MRWRRRLLDRALQRRSSRALVFLRLWPTPLARFPHATSDAWPTLSSCFGCADSNLDELRTIDECRPGDRFVVGGVVWPSRATASDVCEALVALCRWRNSACPHTCHIRCVQALFDAACHWPTPMSPNRCSHATVDECRPRLMPLPLADVVCPMRTCEVRCVQALADASNFCLASHGRCRPADLRPIDSCDGHGWRCVRQADVARRCAAPARCVGPWMMVHALAASLRIR